MLRKMMLLGLVAIIALAGVGRTKADGPSDGRLGRAEVRFLEGMIDHHQMALDMADHCLGKAKNSDLLSLCQAIIAAQQAEIVQMQGWLLAWYNVAYQPTSMQAMLGMDGMANMDHSGMGMANVDPSMMMGMMAGLGRLEGDLYAVAWLESMIDHHDDALHMSARLLARMNGNGEALGHPELRALAEAIISAQTAEIAQMEALITALGG
jgi:uncharacterized protein (DUF305 family)